MTAPIWLDTTARQKYIDQMAELSWDEWEAVLDNCNSRLWDMMLDGGDVRLAIDISEQRSRKNRSNGG